MTDPLKRALAAALLLFALAALAGCSQNEYNESGPAPVAPVNPPPAQRVEKGDAEAPAGMGAMPPEATAAVSFVGKVTVPEALKGKIRAGMVLFVVARTEGPQGPAAVAAKVFKGVGPASFPLQFELCQADAMSGDPIPASLDLLARLDGDGDLKTQQPGDLVADAVPAQSGKPVELRLHEPETREAGGGK